MQHILFFFFSVLSHIGASLFFAKPRFNKISTAAIWLIYGVVFLVLPPDMPPVNYFISFALHLGLFFITFLWAIGLCSCFLALSSKIDCKDTNNFSNFQIFPKENVKKMGFIYLLTLCIVFFLLRTALVLRGPRKIFDFWGALECCWNKFLSHYVRTIGFAVRLSCWFT